MQSNLACNKDADEAYSPPRREHWGLDILRCSVGRQSFIVWLCQSKESAIRRFVNATWYPINEAYTQTESYLGLLCQARDGGPTHDTTLDSSGQHEPPIKRLFGDPEPKRRRRFALPAQSIKGTKTASQMSNLQWSRRDHRPQATSTANASFLENSTFISA